MTGATSTTQRSRASGLSAGRNDIAMRNGNGPNTIPLFENRIAILFFGALLIILALGLFPRQAEAQIVCPTGATVVPGPPPGCRLNGEPVPPVSGGPLPRANVPAGSVVQA